MTLQASGIIGVNNINTELGRASNANSNLNEADLRNLAGVPSGTISLSNFYGKTKYSAIWSGNSAAGQAAINVSGNAFRQATGNYTYLGAWAYAAQDGTFGSTSSQAQWGLGQIGFQTSGNSIRAYYGATYGGWLTFSIATKFSTGTSNAVVSGTGCQWQGSSGLVRLISAVSNSWSYGNYISIN